MENNGTTILLNVKANDGGDLALITDYSGQTVSLVEVTKTGLLHIKQVLRYRTQDS